MEQLQPISEQRSEQILKGAANGCRILVAAIRVSVVKTGLSSIINERLVEITSGRSRARFGRTRAAKRPWQGGASLVDVVHGIVNLVHFGIIFLANLEIGYSTPPLGINLFIASQRFNRSIVTLFKSTLPFLALMIIWLMLVTYIPRLSLWWKKE